MKDGACCAHGIVKISSVHVGNGAIKDAWSCCDCGLRFMPDSSLPQFQPEKSHLHRKLDHCLDEIQKLRIRVSDLETSETIDEAREVTP